MSLVDDLINDLNSDNEEELHSEEEELQNENGEENLNQKSQQNEDISLDNLGERITVDVTKVDDIEPELKLATNTNVLRDQVLGLEKSTTPHEFITKINDVLFKVNEEMEVMERFVKFKYKIVFPELESIVLNPIDYIKTVRVIGQDLINIKALEPEFKQFLSSDKILVLIMSGLQAVKHQFMLNDKDLTIIMNTCDKMVNLHEFQTLLFGFIKDKLNVIVPNTTALIGVVTSGQLLAACSSLNQLCLTPACNVPSIGRKEVSSTIKNTKIPSGYLSENELIKPLPDEIKKQALRILSGKVILSARLDLAQTNPHGDKGSEYKQEFYDKVNKLLTPPEATMDKPLPLPMEYKSKKRGGRRARKLKQKFQMSDLGKAQNRMGFGDKEDSYTNMFGEEVGLGMMKSGNTPINTNTKATITKTMKNRLQNNHEEKFNHLDSFLDDDFPNKRHKQ